MSTNYFNPFFTVKVMDGLFICNQTATKDQQFLMNNKFGLIVNTCPLEFKVLSIANVYKVVNFHWQNSRGNMIDCIEMKLFKGLFDEMGKSLQEGQGVLVVSDRGHSRAITFVLLYLMSRFQWGLFKALEYINSKRQNLQVRAAYLKLLVNYEKSLKPQQSSSNHNESTKSGEKKQDKNGLKAQLPCQIKQQISTKKQKWSESLAKSAEEQLLTNTFRNTCKKHMINELNQEYREMLGKDKEQKKVVNNVKNSTLKEWNKNGMVNGNMIKKNTRKKRVQFSGQIQIIIKQSAMSNIFPQYEELSSEHIIEYERDTRAPIQSTKNEYLEGIHSHNAINNNSCLTNNINQTNNCTQKGLNNTSNKSSEAKYDTKSNQSQPSLPNTQPARPNSKKQISPVPNITNSRMINVRKVQKPSNFYQKNMANHQHQQKNIPENQPIVLTNSQDLYDNQFYHSDLMKHQQQLSQNQSKDSIIDQSSIVREKKDVNTFKQQLFKEGKKPKEQSSTTKSKETLIRTQELLNYQIRPSSLKKFKAIFIDEKQRKVSSPKKKQRRQERILTQPKYDYNFENLGLDEDRNFEDKSRRRLSASQNEDEGFLTGGKIYQHKKSTSTTMTMKMMNRFQKKSSTPIKNEKSCPTPQLMNGEINRQLRSSSHNNFFTRPLSRGGSNSLRMSTKKSATSSIQQNGLQRQTKASDAIFNVNINVNIGKLQTFGTKNRDSGESITNSLANVNKEKLSKVHSHLDKSQLLYNRIRSNSSNDNYSKFSISSQSVGEKGNGEDGGVGKKSKEKLLSKDLIKGNQHRLSNHGHHNRTEQFPVHEAFLLHEEDNVFCSESFTKKEIMDKLNRKLIKNSTNSKNQEHTKKTSILQNNFV